jgi:hypothetical protein
MVGMLIHLLRVVEPMPEAYVTHGTHHHGLKSTLFSKPYHLINPACKDEYDVIESPDAEAVRLNWNWNKLEARTVEHE